MGDVVDLVGRREAAARRALAEAAGRCPVVSDIPRARVHSIDDAAVIEVEFPRGSGSTLRGCLAQYTLNGRLLGIWDPHEEPTHG